MSVQDTRLGIWLMVLATLVFSAQDAISRHLASEYNVLMVVMIRYWAFGLFVVALAARQPGGLRRAVATKMPLVQIGRGLLLAGEICLMVVAFVVLGLAATHAVFAAYPLIVAALSGPVLGERVGWRRWTAIGIGFVGILIILQPGGGALQPAALIPLAAAAGFALYSLMTRYAARTDSAAVSFFWTGTTGAVAMTAVGIWTWEPMAPADWGWMALLCCIAMLGHWLLIKSLEVAEASAVQPFAYLQLVWAAGLGVLLFSEELAPNLLTGAAVVVSAGLFTLWRARRVGAR
jgi:drug/metabolite transporter (DMT)-like permease